MKGVWWVRPPGLTVTPALALQPQRQGPLYLHRGPLTADKFKPEALTIVIVFTTKEKYKRNSQLEPI